MSQDVTKKVPSGLSSKGLSAGAVGLLGAVAIGVSCVAPAYTLSGALGPTVSEVGAQVPAIFLVGFIPMLLVAFGYRELNSAMPDSGTSFTWGARAFGPWLGWMTGWGLVAATVVVLSNLAGIAVDFFYLLISQIFNNPALAELTANPFINVATCLVFMAAATWVSYRDVQTTQKVQLWLVSFQLLTLALLVVVAVVKIATGNAYNATPVEWSWFNPFAVSSFSMFAAGIALSVFIFWGWDVTLTVTEETKNSRTTPGRAATVTIVVILVIYMAVTLATMSFAGLGSEGVGLGNPDIQDNVFFALATPILGPLAVLMSLAVLSSSAASLQSTFVSPARTLLAMGHYGAVSEKYATLSRFKTPGYATIVSACVAAGFYTVMRFVSEAVLWDTILTLGMLVCFYYGLTAFAAVWYFRGHWFTSARDACFRFLFPLVGGLVLLVMFVQTMVDSMDPEFGSGSQLFGIGLVFYLSILMLVAGIVLMVINRVRRPAFFLGQTLRAGTFDPAVDRDQALDPL